ncbi:hypothetical protein [Rheinheimera salexigens]|uniref:Uncharacterized protein n=1 Tax=Rheinheimera salexigens TaxID=1628148 RepID=A0A1E7Q3R1_9GAMM|nr:hypothetical protein [Rheinheimera salexigens]OEY68779.1 hypothetical protein BI198_03780 [Rheinheimera salexigens]
MRLINFRQQQITNNVKWLADVVWEDNDRPLQTIYVTIPNQFNCTLFAASNGFLLAVMVFAMKHREQRIYVEGYIDDWLKYRVEKSLKYLAMWFAHKHLPVIESSEVGSDVNREISDIKSPIRSTALFLSGGVDSYSTLMRNITLVGEEHPKRARYGLLVNGLDIGFLEEQNEKQQELSELSYEAIKQVCKSANIQPVLIDTNVRSLDLDSNLYAKQAHGAILAGMAHFLTSHISDILISSTNDMWHATAWGSSPLIDVNYSSEILAVHHDSEDLSRLNKVALIIGRPEVLKNLRVCPKVYTIPSGYLNCGNCAKCTRTRLELLVLGYKNEYDIFPSASISTWFTDKNLLIQSEYHASQFKELVEPLQKLGLKEEASRVIISLENWRKYQAWINRENIAGLTKRLANETMRTLKSAFKVRFNSRNYSRETII